jgi:hypothetical protein
VRRTLVANRLLAGSACGKRRRGRPLNSVVSHQVMRTWELRKNDGRLTGFEISNLLITRSGVIRTLKRIPGVTITKGERYSERRHDDFCHFTLQGAEFAAIEPWGDNSRYLISADDETGFPYVEAVLRVFEARSLFGGT